MRTPQALLIDLAIVACAAVAAFLLRFDLVAITRARDVVVPFLVTALCIKPITFRTLGLYQRYWRYTSLRDLALVAVAVVASSAVMTAVVLVGLMSGQLDDFSKGVLLVDALLTFSALVGARMAARLVAEAATESAGAAGSARRAIVAGAGDSGILVVRELQKNPSLGLEPVAFLDDDIEKLGKRICGVPVVGLVEAAPRAIAEFAVDEVIIAMPRASGGVVRTIADACRRAGIPSRTVPGLFELLNDSVTVSRLRQVELADLLRRPQVVSDPPMHTYLSGRTVLVTGAGGSIGRELCRQAAAAGPDAVVLVGHGENSIFEAHRELAQAFPHITFVPTLADVRDTHRIARVFGEHQPDVVFHAAAYKHVPLMEQHPEEAVSNNVLGTSAVVEAAIKAGTGRFILISTDKAVSPFGLMGATKRAAEAIVRNAGRRHHRGFVAVRFGNVLGSRGSAFPVFQQQIAAGGPVTVTDPEMHRYFMTIPEAVHLAVQAGGLGRGGELFVLDMGKPIAVLDLVRDLIALSGFDESEIPIVFTGKRPGEKLTESLWEAGARVEATPVSDVLRVVEPDEHQGFDVDVAVGQLGDAIVRGDRRRIDAVLARLIPTYSPPDLELPRAHMGAPITRIVRKVVH
ncbi:MAG: nucleoside-diphosphate sugar epimerase/dehydratase [Vicinamibacterales bacterium]